MSITYSECVFEALVIQRANPHAPCYIFIYRQSVCTIFFPHYLINCTIFEEKVTEHKMCFDFLYNFFQKIPLYKKN